MSRALVLAVLLGLTGCGLVLGPSDPGEVCGDGFWSPLEVCDPAEEVYGPWCTSTCEWNVCGDGELAPDEVCDPGLDETCADSCRPPGCGNGSVEGDELCLVEQAVVDLGGEPAQAVLHDADQDGDLDVVVAVPSLEGLQVVFNDAGTFDRVVAIPTGAGMKGVASGQAELVAIADDAVVWAHWTGVDYDIRATSVEPSLSVTPGSMTSAFAQSTFRAVLMADDGPYQLSSAFVGEEVGPPSALDVGGLASVSLARITRRVQGDEWLMTLAEGSELLLRDRSTEQLLELDAPAVALGGCAGAAATRCEVLVIGDSDVAVVSRGALQARLEGLALREAVGVGWTVADGDDVDVLGITSDGLVLRTAGGSTVPGPAHTDLAGLLVGDLDADGRSDVVALRPEAQQLLIWTDDP